MGLYNNLELNWYTVLYFYLWLIVTSYGLKYNTIITRGRQLVYTLVDFWYTVLFKIFIVFPRLTWGFTF